tara:strand:- start:606 stop:974 length:369 start_codon:yes stop_codon:yes gene_type:complete
LIKGVVMDLYKILVRYYSQKDYHESIEGFIVADSDEAVYDYVDRKQYGYYSDMNEDSGGTFKERMIKVGGEYFDEDYDPHDLYYGATAYGWEKVSEFDLEKGIMILKELDILMNEEDWGDLG